MTVEVSKGAARHVLHMPPRDAWVVGQIFEQGEYSGVAAAVLSDPPVVVDVGAHCGAFAAYARLAWHPGAIVHAFEPFPEHVELLRRNTAPFPEVTVHPFGLGAADGTSDLLLDPGSGAGHSIVPELVPSPAGRVPVSIRDAAAAWDELGLENVDVLKVDAEGVEGDILERLGERLARVKVVLVEYHTDAARRRVDALLPGHALLGALVHSPRVGTLKYLRSDLAVPVPPTKAVPTGPPRVLFASYHCFEDRTSGAALCTHDLFDLLTARGWACEVFTGPHLDTDGLPIGEVLRTRIGATAVPGRAGAVSFTEHRYTAPGGYPVAVFEPDPPAARRSPSPDEARAFAARLDQVVKRFRPDVVLFYGGDPASQVVPTIARSVGARVVFWLHNYAYPTRDAFRGCDAVVVPSEANRAHYRTIGLDPVVLPGPWNWDRMVCDVVNPKYVTFVNPDPAKGVFWFARIAEVLDRSRPDIPLLVVEGRGTIDWFAQCGLELGQSGSLRRMRNTPDPRRFHRLSRLVLMPSLWREGLPRVAVEAMANGIPVLGSGRGGLRQVLDAGGFRLDIPDRFTPDTRITPTPEDVGPWVEAIVRLWDDPVAYAEASSKAKRAAQHTWHPDVLGPKWVDFLENLTRAAKTRSA
ncbi:2-O-methyltransferase NoeI [Gemmata sp. SH-PL17]|uniref:FkbM family methyltransferase n=1 Tax=Gemmata sp. SH-PL17 TaxID=1630693 RepID=UPI00078DC64A|nr:FkbM family methyltransferase [Gemmata sp. SH-PL17]AMV24070.1 2-O-methyltransferase NoeI [Gemmata sp. SH-PL17]